MVAWDEQLWRAVSQHAWDVAASTCRVAPWREPAGRCSSLPRSSSSSVPLTSCWDCALDELSWTPEGQEPLEVAYADLASPAESRVEMGASRWGVEDIRSGLCLPERLCKLGSFFLAAVVLCPGPLGP